MKWKEEERTTKGTKYAKRGKSQDKMLHQKT